MSRARKSTKKRGAKQTPRALYFAYGANTNVPNMRHRCPGAKAVGACILPGWRLVFRGVADVVEEKRSEVFGALWEITPECEKALDLFEGFPRLYVKRYVPIARPGSLLIETVMLYVMRDRSWLGTPSTYYENVLRNGYRVFGLPQGQIDVAIKRARRADAERFRRAVKRIEEGRIEDLDLEGTGTTGWPSDEDEERARRIARFKRETGEDW